MAYEIPDSMDDLVYFSRRNIAETRGKTIGWVPKVDCEKCKNGLMGKPVDPKTKKVKVRALEYVCNHCGHIEPKPEHETKLKALIIYECPFCEHRSETAVPFARKSWYGKKAIVFQCDKCKEKLGLVKKLGVPADFMAKVRGEPVKGKKKAVEPVEDEDDDF
jgi:DNA-directed RNA polymerase subunit RPC12/RpoP